MPCPSCKGQQAFACSVAVAPAVHSRMRLCREPAVERGGLCPGRGTAPFSRGNWVIRDCLTDALALIRVVTASGFELKSRMHLQERSTSLPYFFFYFVLVFVGLVRK